PAAPRLRPAPAHRRDVRRVDDPVRRLAAARPAAVAAQRAAAARLQSRPPDRLAGPEAQRRRHLARHRRRPAVRRPVLSAGLLRPARAIRLDPLDAPGSFRLDEFSVAPVPPPQALWQALSKKLRLLLAYRCAAASAGRGLGLLARGRFGEFYRRVFKGLPDS